MKLSIAFLFAALVIFSGCEKIKDATAIKVDTNFGIDFPVAVTETKATSSTFSVTEELSLADNGDLQEYLSRIDEITLSNLIITVNGLTEGQTISTLTLEVAGIGNILTLNDISMTNNSFSPEVSASLLNQMGDKLLADESLTLTVSGVTSGPMTFVVSCNMDARVAVATL